MNNFGLDWVQGSNWYKCIWGYSYVHPLIHKSFLVSVIMVYAKLYTHFMEFISLALTYESVINMGVDRGCLVGIRVFCYFLDFL